MKVLGVHYEGGDVLVIGFNDIAMFVHCLLDVEAIHKRSQRNPNGGECHVTTRTDTTSEAETSVPGIADGLVNLTILGKETFGFEGERIRIDILIVKHCPAKR